MNLPNFPVVLIGLISATLHAIAVATSPAPDPIDIRTLNMDQTCAYIDEKMEQAMEMLPRLDAAPDVTTLPSTFANGTKAFQRNLMHTKISYLVTPDGRRLPIEIVMLERSRILDDPRPMTLLKRLGISQQLGDGIYRLGCDANIMTIAIRSHKIDFITIAASFID